MAEITKRCIDDPEPESGLVEAMGDMAPQEEPWEHTVLRFRAGMASVQLAVHQAARDKGWWDGVPRETGTLISLMHEELSEMNRAARKGNPESEKTPGYSAMAEEAADVVIRLLDACTYWGIDLGAAIVAKMEHNQTRPYRHGGLKY